MGIFKYFKNIFSKISAENAMNPSNDNLNRNDAIIQKDGQAQKSVDQRLKNLKRKKYTESEMNLSNRLECEILNHLLSKESSNFNVYWDVYIPYGNNNNYMQIDFIVVTGEIIYAIECKEYKTCTSIEVQEDKWKCYYNSGNVYFNPNGIDQNNKHIGVLRKYLDDENFEYKSVVALIVSDEFSSDINNDELIIARISEWEILFKMLDRRVENSLCDSCIGNNFVQINEKIYEGMNVSQYIKEEHKRNIKEKYEK